MDCGITIFSRYPPRFPATLTCPKHALQSLAQRTDEKYALEIAVIRAVSHK